VLVGKGTKRGGLPVFNGRGPGRCRGSLRNPTGPEADNGIKKEVPIAKWSRGLSNGYANMRVRLGDNRAGGCKEISMAWEAMAQVLCVATDELSKPGGFVLEIPTDQLVGGIRKSFPSGICTQVEEKVKGEWMVGRCLRGVGGIGTYWEKDKLVVKMALPWVLRGGIFTWGFREEEEKGVRRMSIDKTAEGMVRALCFYIEVIRRKLNVNICVGPGLREYRGRNLREKGYEAVYELGRWATWKLALEGIVGVDNDGKISTLRGTRDGVKNGEELFKKVYHGYSKEEQKEIREWVGNLKKVREERIGVVEKEAQKRGVSVI